MDRVVNDYVAGRGHDVLIDAGCGDSPYRPLLESHVGEYLACDLPGNPNAQIEFDTEGRLPLPASAADIVLSSQVLEHVPDPSVYLNELRRLLKANGLLVLSTHGTWRYHPDPTDFWRWTRPGLVKLLDQHGFQTERVEGIMGPAATALQQLQDACFLNFPRALRRPAFFVMQLLVELGDRLTSPRARELDAGTWVAVARRRA
ncbi:MAG: class I SAM-dependent methyltransferase [Candidatus Binatia bacterium]